MRQCGDGESAAGPDEPVDQPAGQPAEVCRNWKPSPGNLFVIVLGAFFTHRI